MLSERRCCTQFSVLLLAAHAQSLQQSLLEKFAEAKPDAPSQDNDISEEQPLALFQVRAWRDVVLPSAHSIAKLGGSHLEQHITLLISGHTTKSICSFFMVCALV